MVPYKLLLLLSEDEPVKHAPMRFTPGGCCPCGVQFLECISFGGDDSAFVNGHQYELYLNDVLLGTFAPTNDSYLPFQFQAWIFFSTQPNFPLTVPQDDWGLFHYDEQNVAAQYERQVGPVFDPALLVSGNNTFRIKSIAGSGPMTATIVIGPVKYNDNYPQPPDPPDNLYFEPDPGFSAEWYLERNRDITPPYDQTITFNKP